MGFQFPAYGHESYLATPNAIDGRYLELRRKEEDGTISQEEQALLAAIRQFPDVRDSHLRRLAYKELLESVLNRKVLNRRERIELFSFRQFPRPGSQNAISKRLAAA